MHRFLVITLVTLAFLIPNRSHAIAIDLMGEAAKPLIGAAKDKANGVMKYLWLQPYGGYAFGKADAVSPTVQILNNTGTLQIEGPMVGGRGGFSIFHDNMNLGVDYMKQFAKRKAADGALRKTISAPNTMIGMITSFTVPKTPVKATISRYFTANMNDEQPTSGSGWGYGISFILVNPFILLLEYRDIEFESEATASGIQKLSAMRQYYLGLSFLLL